ncbi:Dsl1p SCDLUD_003910 [Saccharomycodes ludwigii]|uniref:Dsl1p n=1 Tax=Saccharomycodes ludwigii TaxID=36035 RepID=UPI001E8483A6|nr:hypothetical protein SCDLUD_003910 [Saccharomycodes ludwigii]KAH3899630.1 hypothetical protein SCDLUD_003910 [Saccharomycodes ludwigii]
MSEKNIKDRIDQLNHELLSILSDQNSLQLAIKNDKNYNQVFGPTVDNTPSITSPEDLDRLKNQDSEYIAEIDQLLLLKTINQSLNEFQTNLKLSEFENCYYTLKNLVNQFNKLLNLAETNSYQIKPTLPKSISNKIDSLHLDFLTLLENMYNRLIVIRDVDANTKVLNINRSIGNNELHLKELNEFMVKTLLESQESIATKNPIAYNGPDSTLKIWFITSITETSKVEECLKRLDHLITTYLQLSPILNKFVKCFLFSSKIQVELTTTGDERLDLKLIESAENLSLQDYLTSFINMVQFVDSLIGWDSKLMAFFEPVSTLFQKELEKFIKLNIKEILKVGNDAEHHNALLLNLQKLLSQEEGKKSSILTLCGNSKTNLSLLLKDEKVYKQVILDQLIQQKFEELRSFFDKADDNIINEKTLIEISYEIERNVTGDKTSGNVSSIDNKHIGRGHANKNVEDQNNLEEDDWGSAWDDELNLDDIEERKSTNEINVNSNNDTGNLKDTEDDSEDGWGSEVDLNFNDEEEEVGDITITKNNDGANKTYVTVTDAFEVTNIPKHFIRVWDSMNSDLLKENFISSSDENNNTVDIYGVNYKLSLLQTSFFAICNLQYNDGNNWVQFINDMEYILYYLRKKCNITQLEDLVSMSLESKIKIIEKKIKEYIDEQLLIIRHDETEPDWTTTIEKLLPYIHTIIDGKLLKLGNKAQRGKIYYEILYFIFNTCITKQILGWDAISEKSSENLSEFISLILNGTNNFIANNMGVKLEELKLKFKMVGQLLVARLKDIMDNFYNGDFYLFETDELITWVVLLFADTDMRKDCIDEIRTLRGEF